MAAIHFTNADYINLDHLFSGGDISACTKAELERFAVMLARPGAFQHFGAAHFQQICESVRTLILVRMSEEQNMQARKESRLALIISWIALVMSLIQAVASVWQLVSPVPMPARAAESIPSNAALHAALQQTSVVPVSVIKL